MIKMDSGFMVIFTNAAHDGEEYRYTIKDPDIALQNMNKDLPSRTSKWELKAAIKVDNILSFLEANGLNSIRRPADEDNSDTDTISTRSSNNTHRRRNLRDYFTNGQQIYHKCSCLTTWIGTYNSNTNSIVCDGIHYKSLSAFTNAHYTAERSDRVPNSGGWRECTFMNEQGNLRRCIELI
jgi:hypothetical protein